MRIGLLPCHLTCGGELFNPSLYPRVSCHYGVISENTYFNNREGEHYDQAYIIK